MNEHLEWMRIWYECQSCEARSHLQLSSRHMIFEKSYLSTAKVSVYSSHGTILRSMACGIVLVSDQLVSSLDWSDNE